MKIDSITDNNNNIKKNYIVISGNSHKAFCKIQCFYNNNFKKMKKKPDTRFRRKLSEPDKGFL